MVAVGSQHFIALTAERTVFAWGSNTQGQLALGTQPEESIQSPTEIMSLRGKSIHKVCFTVSAEPKADMHVVEIN